MVSVAKPWLICSYHGHRYSGYEISEYTATHTLTHTHTDALML